MIKNITALFIKQAKDTFKNIEVLVLFIVYPCIAYIMSTTMAGEAGMQDFFITTFAIMHGIFTPIVATAAFLAEEKEKNTLRVLFMSGITLPEYLISAGGFVALATMLTGSSFIFMAEMTGAETLKFMLSLLAGCCISILLGMCIGLRSKNVAAANALAVPFAMVFAFMPMLASFSEAVENVARFTYGQQISYLMSGKGIELFGGVAVAVNILILLILSIVFYRKLRLEE